LGPSGRLLFSSHNKYDVGNYAQSLGKIAEKYNVDIVYGRRELSANFDITCHNTIDVINVGTHTMNHKEVDGFKFVLWKNFGIESRGMSRAGILSSIYGLPYHYLRYLEGLYGQTPEYFHFGA